MGQPHCCAPYQKHPPDWEAGVALNTACTFGVDGPRQLPCEPGSPEAIGQCIGCAPLQVEVGIMSREEADACVSVEFNPVRARFAGAEDVWTRDILNLGVSPAAILAKVTHPLVDCTLQNTLC